MSFQFKSFEQIVADMVAKMSSETPLTDFSDGSVILTLLEASAQEDFQQYVQMLNIIRQYNLDTTEGAELDDRAAEYGLTRLNPLPHSGFVTISDSRFVKTYTKIYAGLPGPLSGATVINVDNASSFPASGQLYIGRGTQNTEGPIAYTATPVDNTSYWTITLDVALLNDHGTDETVILAQFGNRVVDAGTEIKVPENDFSDEIIFELNQSVTLLDGENSIQNVLVTALQPSGATVPANSVVEFGNSPFTGALVTNPSPFVNGRDEETDQELRDRIREHIQGLSRGTAQSIRSSIIGLIDAGTNSSIVSAKIVAPTILADGPTRVYIDNGRGLEPELASIGLEVVVDSATGGEQFFQLENFPIIKANVITQNVEPFSLSGGETLIYSIGTDSESFTFLSTDFKTEGSAEATEISEAINNRSSLIEARTISSDNGKQVIVWAKRDSNENLKIDSDSTSQVALNFIEREVFTSKIYKNDILLTKDGLTANVSSGVHPFDLSTSVVDTTDGDITVNSNSRIVTKSIAGVDPFKQKIFRGDYIKFEGDADSFYTKVQEVVSDTKLILDQAYPPTGGGVGDIRIWASPQLEIASNGDIIETEVVTFGPNDLGSPATTLANIALIPIQRDINLSKVQLSVNDTKVQLISEKENSAESKMQVTGGGAAVSMGYCTSGPLTGTLDFSANEITVIGSGTLFTQELVEGQWIKATLDGKSSYTKIRTIESDTILYLSEGYRGPDRIGAAALKINFGEESIGSNEDYVLNRFNGQIELTEPLVLGDSLTAGSINTRAFKDSISETFNFDTIGSSSTLIVCIDDGFISEVSTGDNVAPYDTLISTNLIGFDANLFNGFYIRFTSGNNIGETSFVASYNNLTGTIILTTGLTNPIVVGDKFQMCQVVSFNHVVDFANSAAATALEVIDAINNILLGGLAELKDDSSIRLRTSNFSESGSIEIIGGSANSVLNFNTDKALNQESNIASVVSANSDREGLTSNLGFTLGPDQNLVVILDNDAQNKTFSVPIKVNGTITTGGVGTFADSSLAAKYPDNDFFNDFWIYWLSGANEGNTGIITDYIGVSGIFTFSVLYPLAGSNTVSIGDTFALVPKTAENFVKLTKDKNTTTLSLFATIEAVGLTGDYIQIATVNPGSSGKIYVTGGTANSLGIAVEGIVAGSPINDVLVNSKAGLTKGLPVNLNVQVPITTGDLIAPFDTFLASSLIGAIPNYFAGFDVEFITGDNIGFKTTVATYNNVTGEIVLSNAPSNSIGVNDIVRIGRQLFISDISGASAPYNIQFTDSSGTDIDVSGFTAERQSTIRDINGFHFETTQREGIDGYKYFTGLIQEAQFTIDGLDRDPTNYPGIGAAGTQFEVLSPVLVNLTIILDVTTEEGVSLSSVSGLVSNAVQEYINSRGVGEDVILSEIIASAQSVDGIFDVSITNISENISIADNELARISSEDLIIG